MIECRARGLEIPHLLIDDAEVAHRIEMVVAHGERGFAGRCGLRVAPQSAERERAIRRGDEVARREAERVVVYLERLLESLLFNECVAEIGEPDGPVGRENRRALQYSDGVGRGAALVERQAEVVVCVRVCRLELHRAPKVRDRLVVQAALGPNGTRIVVGFRVTGVLLDDLVVAFEGGVEVAVEMALHRRIEAVDARVA